MYWYHQPRYLVRYKSIYLVKYYLRYLGNISQWWNISKNIWWNISQDICCNINPYIWWNISKDIWWNIHQDIWWNIHQDLLTYQAGGNLESYLAESFTGIGIYSHIPVCLCLHPTNSIFNDRQSWNCKKSAKNQEIRKFTKIWAKEKWILVQRWW